LTPSSAGQIPTNFKVKFQVMVFFCHIC
jgi:hypothetical protein